MGTAQRSFLRGDRLSRFTQDWPDFSTENSASWELPQSWANWEDELSCRRVNKSRKMSSLLSAK